MICPIFILVFLTFPYIDALCNSHSPTVSNILVMKDGTPTLQTIVNTDILIPGTWCLQLTDKLNTDDGVPLTAEVPDTIELSISAVNAIQRSILTGAIVADIPSYPMRCDDSNAPRFCYLYKEVCDRGDGQFRGDPIPDWYTKPTPTGYISPTYENWGHECRCTNGVLSCQGYAWHEVTRVFIPPENIYRAWTMSDQYQYRYYIDASGTLFNSNTSSVYNSYGTIGDTVLLSNDGTTVTMSLSIGEFSALPRGAQLIQPFDQSISPKILPHSWISTNFRCGETNNPAWATGAGATFQDAMEDAKDCFGRKMGGTAWAVNVGDSPSGSNAYDRTISVDSQPLNVEYQSVIQSNSYTGDDQLVLTIVPKNIRVHIKAVFPARKVIAFEDTARCKLESCSAVALFTSTGASLECVCAEHTPGTLLVNTTDVKTKEHASTVVSLNAKDKNFNYVLALNGSNGLSVCTKDNCVNANITWIHENNLYNKSGDVPPTKNTRDSSGDCFTCFDPSPGDWIISILSFRGLETLIRCIQSGNISCLTGSILGSIANIIMLVVLFYILRALYRCFKNRDKSNNKIVKMKQRTKNDDQEMTINPVAANNA